MHMRKYVDVAIIGAGNGGLAAAMATSGQGLKTLVLERHNLPGGAATTFVRGRYEFEVSLHEACDIGEKNDRGMYGQVLDDFGVDLDWYVDKHIYHCVIPSEGIDVHLPAERKGFIDEMERQVPGCRKSVEAFFKVLDKAADGFRYMIDNVPPNYFEGTPGAVVQKVKHDAALAKLKATLVAKYPEFLKMTSITTAEGLSHLGVPEKAQLIMTQYWPYLGAEPKTMDFFTYAFMFLMYLEKGAWFPDMKSHGLSLAQEKVIRDNGGEIWYDTAVKELIVENGKVVGVRTDKWDIYAKEIISNVHPHIVLGNMMKTEDIPTETLKYYNSKKIAMNLYTAYLGMDCTAEELGIKEYSNMISMIGNQDDLVDSLYTKDNNGYLIINCLNTIYPDSSPAGTCTLFLTSGSYGDIMKDVKPQDYRKFKQKCTERMIDIAEKALGIDIRSHIEEIEMAHAPTFVRYMGQPNGTPYGYQVKTNDGFAFRCMNEIEYHQIPGLHFCGSTGILTDGYISACISGAMSAKYVIEKIDAEKAKTRTRGR